MAIPDRPTISVSNIRATLVDLASSAYSEPSGGALLLDTYPGAAAAYSLRKLRAAYAGSAIRVRRSSDNTEQDIGFDGAGALDTAALTTFVGASDGYVTTWYDQSANANHAVQATVADQPLIVVEDGVPRLRFDTTVRYLVAPHHASLSFPAPITALAFAMRGAGGGKRVIDKGGAWGLGDQGTAAKFTTYGKKDYLTSAAAYWRRSSPRMIGAELLTDFDVRFSDNLHRREVVAHTGDAGTTTQGFYIGCRSTLAEGWEGDVREALLYNQTFSDAEWADIRAHYDDNTDLVVTTFDVGRVSATNSASYLTVPSYDGSNEVVHPDVVDMGAGNTWNGYRYWMVFTPYPGEVADHENPSLVASNDKTTWEVPAGITNPVIAKPDGGYNSDPDITISGGTMYILWREVALGFSTLKLSSTTDGVTLTAPVTLLQEAGNALYSPSISHDGTQWVMHYSNGVDVLYKRTASAIDGLWSDPVTCSLSAGQCYHLDVIHSDGVFYAVFLSGGQLNFGTSDDGIVWDVTNAAFLAENPVGWDDAGLYRSTFVGSAATGFDLWYTGISSTDGYRFGYTTINVASVP